MKCNVYHKIDGYRAHIQAQILFNTSDSILSIDEVHMGSIIIMLHKQVQGI